MSRTRAFLGCIVSVFILLLSALPVSSADNVPIVISSPYSTKSRALTVHITKKSANSLSPSTSSPPGNGQGISVNPNVEVYVAGYAEVERSNQCTEISPGSFTITQQPQHGTIRLSTDSETNPSCGSTFQYGDAYYTWTDTQSDATEDSFSIDWSTPDGQFNYPSSWSAELFPKALGKPDCNSTCGDPIGIATGNVYEQIADYETYGINTLGFMRYYNSKAISTTYAVSLGSNWRTNYDRYLNVVSSTAVNVERKDGQVLFFTNDGNEWVSDSDVDITLTQSGSSWTLTDSDDTVETYTQLGTGEALLSTIKTRNGYTQTLHYNGSNQLTSVSDSYNRTLTLTYLSSGLLNTLTTPEGLVLTYGYSSSGLNPGVNDQLASVSYSTSPITKKSYTYVQNFDLATATDENGNTTSWTYDATGRGLTSQSQNGANHTTVSYDDATGNRTVTNALGQQEVYHFFVINGAPKVDDVDRTATSTVPINSKYFNYDNAGYVSVLYDWNGNETNYVNNSHGDPTSITEAYGTAQARTTTITYDSTWVHLAHQIAAPRKTTAFTYDASGNMLTKTETDTAGGSTNGQTRTWTYTYDATGHVLTATGPRTDVTQTTTYSYTGNNVATVTDASGHISHITSYNGSGQPLSMTDPNGVVTTFTYDARDRMLTRTVQAASGNATDSFAYDAAGNVTKITLPDGSYLAYTYDTAHRVTKVTDNLGDQITYTLDANGDVTQRQVLNSANAVSKTQSAVFDSLGRTLQQIGAASQTTYFTYDANGNNLTRKNPLGDTTSQSFDALNRLLTSTDPLTNVTSTARDSQNNLTGVTDPRTLVTTYTYDGFGQVIAQASPDSGSTSYTLDKAGNRVSETDARGIVTNRTFDKLNRVLTETYPASSGENVTYSYDSTTNGNFGVGRLTGFTDASGSDALAYNERGDVVADTRVISGYSYKTAYSYDLADHVLSMTYPSGHIITYARDVLGRINAIAYKPTSTSAATTLASSIGYKAFSNLYLSLTYGNGLVTNLTYDKDWRVTNIATTPSIQNLTMAYNGVDNVTSITDGLDATRNQTFTYDKDYRLLTASGKYGALSYSYDADGNRSSATSGGVTSTYSYPSSSARLSSVVTGGSTRSLTYTANGNVATDSADATFTYNNRNRMKQSVNTSSLTSTYLYNALGQMVQRTANGFTKQLVYDRFGHVLAEYSGTGALFREYVYFNDLPIAQIETYGNNIYYIHSDATGTPQKMTDPSKNVIWDRIQKPFGETYSTAGATAWFLRFPGQYADSLTTTNQNWMRDYDYTTGRYIESDPVGLLGGVNLYSYANGNPVRYIDPMGLKTVVIINRNGVGGHAGLFVSDGGDGNSVVYDPYGSYNPSDHAPATANPLTRDAQYPPRGSDGTLYGANLQDYMSYQKTDGPDVHSYTFDTTPEQEKQIIKQAEQTGESGTVLINGTCAGNVSSSLNGVGPFQDIGIHRFPATLDKALSTLQNQ